MTSGKTAFVTLVTSDAYAVGAQVLAKSLKDSGTKHLIICLVTENVSSESLKNLQATFDEVRQVEALDSKDQKNLSLLGRPELGCTFTKIQVWNQLDLSKVVFMDADMLALKNIDELFEERDEFSAAPDVGWPDCFNSGLFVCKPNAKTYCDLLQMAKSNGSFDGGDQGLLNQYFSDWARGDSSKRLPFGYNLTFSSSYSYLPAFKHFRNTIKVVHFIGANKPWTFHRMADGRVCPRGNLSGDSLEFVQLWWRSFDSLKLTRSSTSRSSPSQGHHDQANKHVLNTPLLNCFHYL